MIEIILLSNGLAMDAFSVSVSFGCCHPNSKLTSALRLAFFTGLFQFFMPLIGWFAGHFIGKFFLTQSYWIAFGILTIIGIKMIIDAVMKKAECLPVDISRGKHLLGVCTATSIDALAAGLSLGILKTSLFLSAGLIGIITFTLSLLGVYLGKIVGFALGKWAEIAGGVMLIVIGLNILIKGI